MITNRSLGAIVVASLLVLAVSYSRPSTGAGAADGCVPLGSGCVTVLGSLETVRPTDAVSGTKSAQLLAARNEFESFQVVIQAGASPLTKVDVEMNPTEPLRSSSGTEIPNDYVTIYREDYIKTAVRSDLEASTGSLPDALIPTIDIFDHEERHAFSSSDGTFTFDVPSNENRVGWVDVLIPSTLRDGTAPTPGTYEGSLLVTASGETAHIPISLDLLPFDLPGPGERGAGTLTTVFDLNHNNPCAAHGVNCASRAGWELQSRYVRAALDNRIVAGHPSTTPTPGVSGQLFRELILPLIRGGPASPARLANARNAPFFLYSWCHVRDRCVQSWREEAERDNFADDVILYPADEPYLSRKRWKGLRERMRNVRAVWPGLRIATTATIRDADKFGGRLDAQPVRDAIDIFIVLEQVLHGRFGDPFHWDQTYLGDQRPRYRPWEAGSPDREVWVYSDCVSYWCNPTPRYDGYDAQTYFEGWPAYAIDQPATEQRTLGWLAYKYDVTGEYYFDLVRRLKTAWTDQYNEGGNGDGTLFYPGVPEGRASPGDPGFIPAIGGPTDIPIESIRLKRIRDAREDFAYLRLASERGFEAQVRARVDELFEVTSDHDDAMWTVVTPGALEAARRDVAGFLR